jgi:hypothetical protein
MQFIDLRVALRQEFLPQKFSTQKYVKKLTRSFVGYLTVLSVTV